MAKRDIVVIGGSAGSLPALQELLSFIPDDLEAAILIAAHRRRVGGTDLLPGIVKRYSRFSTVSASEGLSIEPGRIYVIPPEGGLRIHRQSLRLVADKEARPGIIIDVLCRSAAEAYGNRRNCILPRRHSRHNFVTKL